MESVAAGLVDVSKWIVGIGLLLFVAGFLIDLFGVSADTPKPSLTDQLVGILKNFAKLMFDSTKPAGVRLSAGGAFLVVLGVVGLLGGLALGAASGASGSPQPTPSPSPSPTG